MPPEIDRNDPNYAFTRAAREERIAEIDRSLGYSPASYAMPPPAAAPVAQPGTPATPGTAPGWAGQPYPGWQPPQGPSPQPDPAIAERERYERQLAEARAQNATYQGVLHYIQQDLMRRDDEAFRQRREGLDPETAIYETEQRYQQQLEQARQAQWQTAQQARQALMALHVDGFTRELFDTYGDLSPEQRQAVLDTPVNPNDPESGANARASIAAAYHGMNERLHQLGLGQGVSIYTAAGVNRVGGISPSGPVQGPQPGQPGYHRDPAVREIMNAPYVGVRY
jgi:hypothetical protein